MPLKFFINLARDQTRAKAMQETFAACKHQPDRFNAVDWRALASNDQAYFYSTDLNEKSYFRSLTAGECGCYASHIEIWRMLVESDAPWALVLEDDVEPTTSFDGVLDAIDTLPPHWDMIKLVGRDKEKVARQRAILPSHQLIQYTRIPSLTGAYVVSHVGAKKLLASRQPFARPIDVDLRAWWENDLRVFGVLPYPIQLAATSSDSSIGARAGTRDLAMRIGKAKSLLAYHLKVLMTSDRLSVMWKNMWP